MALDSRAKGARLQALRLQFQDQLEDQLRLIQAMWESAKQGAPGLAGPEGELRRKAHNLAGAAGTFGFPRLGEGARALELRLLDRVEGAPLEPEARPSVEALIARLFELAREGPERLAKEAQGPPRAAPKDASVLLLYALEDDALLAREIALQLEPFGFQVEGFATAEALEAAMARNRPAALIADVTFPGDALGGPHVAGRIEALSSGQVPVVFISFRDDWAAHLAAVRAGGQGYFPKPLDFLALVERLDHLVGRIQETPYRILMVEDEVLLAQHYAMVLRDAGMEVEVLNEPSRLIEQAFAFGPDLLLLDVLMPGCSGVEAAQVVRQYPGFTHLPITFLSTIQGVEGRLDALRAGGDDFLNKPITDAHLAAGVAIRAKRFRALSALMNRDSLTGLLNHISFKLALEREISQTARRDGHLCMAMIDIDHFKSVNDRFGHPVGDRVIKSLSRLLTQRLRKGDLVARYGGEEFAILLPDTDPAAAFAVLDGLREAFWRLIHLHGGGVFQASFSGGIAGFPGHGGMEGLIEAADGALYAAKHAGRNRIAVDSASV